MPNRLDRSNSMRFLWLVAFAGVVVVFQLAANGWVAYRHGLNDRYGFDLAASGGGVYVKIVYANGPAEGRLQVGDRVIALDDDIQVSRTGWRDLVKYRLHGRPEGTSYALRVLRDGSEQTIRLQLATYRLPQPWTKLQVIISAFIVALSLFVVGLIIGAFKPDDRAARLAFGAMTLFGSNYLFFYIMDRQLDQLSGFEPWLWFWALTLSGGSAFFSLSYNFSYVFPDGSLPGALWERLKWLLYGLGLSVYAGAVAQRALWLHGLETDGDIAAFARLGFYRGSVNDVYSVLSMIATGCVMLRNYRLVAEPAQRRRIKLVVFGTLAPLLFNLPLYLFRVLLGLFGHNEFKSTEAFSLVAWLINLSVILTPLAWAYAIFKHQVLDVRLVVRQGLSYLLAKNVLSALLAAPVIVLALRIGLNADRPLKEILFAQPLNLALIGLAALSLLLRRQLRRWLDRRFFREEYRQEQVLLELIEKIKTINSLPELTETVHQQMRDALHPRVIHLYYRERDLIYTGTSQLRRLYLTLPPDAQLLRLLDGTTEVLDFPTTALDGLPPVERQWLENLNVQLIAPLGGTERRLIGLLLLGEKQSELPYLREDRALLKAVAHQMAVVCENLHLKEQVSQERKIKHDVLARLDGQQVNLLTECPLCGVCYDRDESYCQDDNLPLTLTLPVERTIDGKYQLEKRVGAGGMGAVYAATDLRLKRRVAIKILTGSLFGNRDAQQRFTREAQASARLTHPNIVAVHDYGQAGTAGAYLVMEFLTGCSLRAEMARRVVCPPSLVAEWFAQILTGLAAAHDAGVLHRDLKPDNVWLAAQPDGQPLLKLLDFGLAKLRSLEQAGDASLTLPGTVLGTPGYMAPEQLAGQEADECSDIFSLGVMVVEALTGSRPFAGRDFAELQAAMATQFYHLPGDSPEVVRLDAVVQRCLAYDRRQRYANIAELQAVLLPALRACAPQPLSSLHQGVRETGLDQPLDTRKSDLNQLPHTAPTDVSPPVTKLD
ncbi:MAG: protein kinase [Acidobacteriota bacterium]